MAKAEKAPSRQQAEGEVYVTSSGTYYTNPKIDADAIFDASFNSYVQENIERHITLLFSDEPVVKVLDPDGEVDDDLTLSLATQCSHPDVNLWANIKRTYRDTYLWGPSIINDVWPKVEGEYKLTALNRLPPESFASAPPSSGGRTYNEILPGITLSKDKKVELWQTQSGGGMPRKVERADLITEPTQTVLGGVSRIIPIIPLLSMLKFSWQSQMQRVNRIGAPFMYIKILGVPVKNSNRDDIAWAQKILQNWGKSTSYQLRDNMELVTPSVQDSASALEGIAFLEKRIAATFDPISIMKKEGSTIGGNAASELDTLKLWIKSVHSWLESAYERILNRYCEYNGLEGYRVEITIPEPSPDSRDMDLKQAQAGYQTRALKTNEIRAKLGLDPLEDKDLADLEQQYAARQPAPAQPMAFMVREGPVLNAAPPDPDAEALAARLQAIEAKAETRIIRALRHEKGGTTD